MPTRCSLVNPIWGQGEVSAIWNLVFDMELGWMPLIQDRIAMCQSRAVHAQAEGERIHRAGYDHRRRSRKELGTVQGGAADGPVLFR